MKVGQRWEALTAVIVLSAKGKKEWQSLWVNQRGGPRRVGGRAGLSAQSGAAEGAGQAE